MSDLYQEIILDAYKHPQHKGSITEADAISDEINASCGDSVRVYLKIDQHGKVVDIKWEGNGCAISQATMSLLTDKIMRDQLTISQINDLSKNDLLKLLGLDEISIGREKCMMIGLKAIQKVEGKQ